MACNSCNDNNQLYYTSCEETPATVGCLTITDTQCVEYNGDALTCLGIEPRTRLESIIQLIDSKFCTVQTGDYSAYNTFCITNPDDESVVTEKDFVEGISKFVCTLETTFNTFVEETYVDDLTLINTNITGIKNPAITTCGTVGVISSDPLNTVLTKYGTALCDIYSKISISGVNWTSCYNMGTPSSIAAAFNMLIAMICSTKTLAETGGDTYKIKTSASDINPDYIINKLTGTCVTATEYTHTDGTKKINLALSKTLNKYQFNGAQFDVTNTASDTCEETYAVSIKPGLLGGDGPAVNCVTIQNIMQIENTNLHSNSPIQLYGASSSGCKAFTACHVRNMMVGSATSGDYVIRVDATQTNVCNRVTLVPTSGGGAVNPCYAAGWTDITGQITNVNIGGTTAVLQSPGSFSTLAYRYTKDGDINLRGAVVFDVNINGGTAPYLRGGFTAKLGAVNTTCNPSKFPGATDTIFRRVPVNTFSAFSGSDGNIGNFYGVVRMFGNGDLYLDITFAIQSNTLSYNDVTFYLDGVTFNL